VDRKSASDNRPVYGNTFSTGDSDLNPDRVARLQVSAWWYLASARLGNHAPRIDRGQLVKTETAAALIVLAALILISIVLPAPIGPTADLPIPREEVQAPWFFLWVQALLRSLPPVVAGIFIPLGLLALLMIIPYLIDRSKDGIAVWFNWPGRIAQITAIAIFIGLIILTLVEVSQ
jgi:hypothetical protein